MAEALLRAKLEEVESLDEWRVESAGTWASPGQPAAEFSQEAMRERDLDLSGHRSKVVSQEYLSNFDLILTMERNHKEALQVEFPRFRDRIYLLSEMVDQNRDVEDPFGGSKMEYQATAREIESVIDEGFEKIKALAERNRSR
jgi:protein-tyrosine-phosphatase